MDNVSKKWTPDHDAQLRAMASAGMTLAEISGKLGKTISIIRGRAEQLGVNVKAADGNRTSTTKAQPTEPLG